MKKLWLAALTAFTLVACGGGGNPGTGGGTGGGTETPAGTMTIQVITGASSSAQGVISITASGAPPGRVRPCWIPKVLQLPMKLLRFRKMVGVC